MKWLKEEYYKNVFRNYVFRIASMGLSLISVRVNLGFLGATLYGLWMTIASVISWMSSGDFGIGNGLRNELAIAYGQNDVQRQKNLIKTALNSIRKIALVLFVGVLLLTEVLLALNLLEQTLRLPMYITGVFFCINLYYGMVDSIAYSYQKSWMVTMKNSLSSLCVIVTVVILTYCKAHANLVLYAVLQGTCTLVPNLLLAGILKYQGIQIFGIKSAIVEENNLRKSIMNVGLQFFGLQICGMVLYSTDNMIINYCLSSEMVTKYSIITKIYETGSSLYSILLIALWSAVTLHIAQNDFEWIKNKIKELLLVWAGFSVGVVGVSLLLNPIVRIWLGESAIYYEPSIVMLFALYCITTTFSAIFVNILNGAGVIRFQLFLAIFGAAINIPLSVFLAKNLGWGIFGVKFATYVSAIISGVGMTIQALTYIKKQSNVVSRNR